jgi:hypothetical protein
LIVVGVTVAAGALVGPVAGDAEAAVVVCQRKSKIRLRDGSCKPKEQAVQLEGGSIDTTTLGQVPSAATADSATTAGTAGAATTAQTADSATTALTAGDAGLLDGLDSTALQGRIRWAHVASGGTSILAQSGGISLVTEPVTGIVVLDFGQDLRNHGIIATVRNGLPNRGWAQVSICGFPNGGGPETTLCNVGGDVTDMPNELAVAIVDHDGNAVDRNFYVAVLP